MTLSKIWNAIIKAHSQGWNRGWDIDLIEVQSVIGIN